jgi:AcrR family transcriptional regulator
MDDMESESARARAMDDTRTRILDVALEVLGRSPEAGMGDIASAAGVVRRTVYGYFPTRTELVLTLTQRAVDEIAAVLDEVNAPDRSADSVWVDFVARLWPLTHRYRVLLALRRGEYGEEIHTRLGPVDATLADLVQRGQDGKVFGRHLPAHVLGQVAYAAVFAVADHGRTGEDLSVGAAAMTSLLVLGVPAARARGLVKTRA